MESLIKYGIGNLAAGPASDPEGDVLLNALTNLLTLSGSNFQELNAKLGDKFKAAEELPDGIEKEKQMKMLAKEFEPFSKELLKAAGIGSQELLPVPFFLKKVLWESLNDTIVPKFLMKMYRDVAVSGKPDQAFAAKLGHFKDMQHLQEVAEVAAENLVPLAKEMLTQADTSAAEKLQAALEGTAFGFLDAQWIQKGIEAAVEGQQPGFQQTWSFVQQYLEKILFHMLSHAAAYGEPDEAVAEKKAALPAIVSSLLGAAEKYFKENNVHIEAKIDALMREDPSKTREQHLIDLFTKEAFMIAGLSEDVPADPGIREEGDPGRLEGKGAAPDPLHPVQGYHRPPETSEGIPQQIECAARRRRACQSRNRRRGRGIQGRKHPAAASGKTLGNDRHSRSGQADRSDLRPAGGGYQALRQRLPDRRCRRYRRNAERPAAREEIPNVGRGPAAMARRRHQFMMLGKQSIPLEWMEQCWAMLEMEITM